MPQSGRICSHALSVSSPRPTNAADLPVYRSQQRGGYQRKILPFVRHALALERVTVNVLGFSIPDNDGSRPTP